MCDNAFAELSPLASFSSQTIGEQFQFPVVVRGAHAIRTVSYVAMCHSLGTLIVVGCERTTWTAGIFNIRQADLSFVQIEHPDVVM